MKKILLIFVAMLSLMLVATGCSNNGDTEYNYYTAEQTKEAIENGDEIILLDIQVEEEWEAHHIKGAIPTHAYPVKEDEDKAKLDAVLSQLEGEQPIIIVCPSGAGGATRTIDYLKTKGIDEDRLFILKGGQSSWPYAELLEGTDTTVEIVEFVDTSYIVDAEWLNDNLGREDLLILDARGSDTYDKGHIPGSIAVMWQNFADMSGAPGENPNWGTVLEPNALSEKLSEFGISKDKEIVVYTSTKGGWGEEGRIVWMLKRAGFDNVKMLDGGFEYWEANNYEVSKDKVEPTPAVVEVTALDNSTNIDTEELASKLEEVVIIDVREENEFEGAQKYGEARGGHLPGAINITFNEFMNDDGTLKTAQEIKAILDEYGIEKDDEIVTYCTAGIRSAHMQIVLTMMGYENAKNYDASFYAWAGNEDLELEK